MITPARIEQLATKPDVRSIAVRNFLSSLGGSTAYNAQLNLEADAKSYKWNGKTKAAIRTGIKEHFSEKLHTAKKEPSHSVKAAPTSKV